VSGVIATLSYQPIGLRGHDEVVPVEAADLVGPPSHRDTSPLGEQGWMVTLCLGEGADLVREAQGVGEIREVEDPLELGDPITLEQLPGRDVTPQLSDLRLGHAGRVATAGDTLLAEQGAHGTHLSSLRLAAKLRSPDALFGDLHAVDTLEAEEQFDEVCRRLGGGPLHDRPERLLNILAEGGFIGIPSLGSKDCSDMVGAASHIRNAGIEEQRARPDDVLVRDAVLVRVVALR
jgi:hypothetical protein